MIRAGGSGAPHDAGPAGLPGGPLDAPPVAAPRTSIDRIGVALALVLAMAPLLPRGPVYLGWPRHTWADLVVPALVLVWLSARVAARGRRPHASPIPLWPWDLWAATVAGSAALGLMAENIVTSPVFGMKLAAFGELLRPMHQTVHPLYPLRVATNLLQGWLALRLVVAICRRAEEPARRAALALAGWGAGFLAVALFAIAQYATRFHLHPFWVNANRSLVRTHATMDDPNALGACLVLAIGLLVGVLRLEAVARRRAWWAVLLAVGTAGLVTTMSRSALGALILAPAAVLALGPAPLTRPERHVRAAARLIVATLAIAVLSSMVLRAFTSEQRRTNPSGPVDMVVKTFDPRESTGWVLRGRLPWWQAAVAMFEEQPLTGVGLGRYQRLMQSYGGGKFAENAHNFYLQSFAESGAIGGAAFLALCGSVVWTFAGHVRRARGAWPRAVALGALIGTAGFLTTLLTGHTLLVTAGQLTWAAFVALAASIARGPAEADQGAPPGRARQALAAAAFVGVAAIAPLVGLARGVGPVLGAWGYSAGLYGVEHSRSGDRYRWTGGSARLELQAPAGARALVVETAAGRPVRSGAPVRLRVRADGQVHEESVTQPGRREVRLPLQPRETPARVLLVIEVEPTLVPASDGRSGDTRALGVQLFVPRFEVSDAAPGA